MMRMCCVCHKVEREGAWESVACLPENELVTHGYCPECFVEAMAEINELTGALVAGGLTFPGWAAMRG
jgi:hypothetical protein